MIKKINLDKILFLLIFLTSTLRITSSIGIYLLSIFLPLAFTILSIINRKYIKISLSSIVIILIIIFNWLGFYLFNQNSYLIINDKQYILIITMILISSSYLNSKYSYNNDVNLNSVFTIILLFHVIMFMIQFAMWYGFSYDLDFGTLTGGNPHRAYYYNGLFRATGIFEEPSIYCAYIFSFLTVRYLSTKKNDVFSYIAIISMILSFATIGIILSILYIIITNSKLNLLHIGISIIAFLFLASYGGEYILMRIDLLSSGTDGSSNTKFFIFNEYLTNFRNFIFGYGLLYKEMLITKLYDGLGDMTLYLNSFIIFGFLGIFIPITLLYSLFKNYKQLGFRCCLLVLISFIKMASFHYPYFWFYFYLIISPITIFNVKKISTKKVFNIN